MSYVVGTNKNCVDTMTNEIANTRSDAVLCMARRIANHIAMGRTKEEIADEFRDCQPELVFLAYAAATVLLYGVRG